MERPTAEQIAQVITGIDVAGLAPDEIRHLVVIEAARRKVPFGQIPWIIDELERRTGLSIHDLDDAHRQIAFRHRKRRTR